jgi:uncharacterized protein (DUF849 family)
VPFDHAVERPTASATPAAPRAVRAHAKCATPCSILAAGRHQMRLGTIGAIMGGNVRVGLEDSIYQGKDELARSNADQVKKIRGILEALSLEPATPDEARARLGLKGGDRVAF